MISLGVGGLIFGGVITGYIQSANQAEWSAYQLAAHSLAAQRLESTRAVKWDTQASPPVDMFVSSNFPPLAEVLDVPIGGGNPIQATTSVYISTISTEPPLKMIRVETVWPFRDRGPFTNAIASYRASDQ